MGYLCEDAVMLRSKAIQLFDSSVIREPAAAKCVLLFKSGCKYSGQRAVLTKLETGK